MDVIVKRRINIHNSPRINFKFPSTISSAPMLYSCIPRSRTYSRALCTFSHFCTRSRGFEAYFPSDSFPRISRRCISSTYAPNSDKISARERRMLREVVVEYRSAQRRTPVARSFCSDCAGGMLRDASLVFSLAPMTDLSVHLI